MKIYREIPRFKPLGYSNTIIASGLNTLLNTISEVLEKAKKSRSASNCYQSMTNR